MLGMGRFPRAVARLLAMEDDSSRLGGRRVEVGCFCGEVAGCSCFSVGSVTDVVVASALASWR